MNKMCALFVIMALAAGSGLSQTGADKSGAQAPPSDPAWAKLAAPGEHHKHLESLVGKWTQVVRVRPGPDAPWQESTGTAEYKLILGGRFIMEEVKCTMFGRPFGWVGIYGYDNTQEKHTAVWADDSGTNTEFGLGQCDPSGKAITYTGERPDPRRPTAMTKFKWVISLEANDKLLIEMYEVGKNGKEIKNAEIIATRNK